MANGFKCPLCDKEYEKIRALHGHMLKAHVEEYRAKDCKLSNFGLIYGGIRTPETRKKAEVNKGGSAGSARPSDFRILNKSNSEELAAYEEGYRFLSGGTVYSVEEAQERGWI